MGEFKGTKEPWVVVEYGGIGGNGFLVGANQTREGVDIIATLPNGKREDADVLAAAPELLEALRLVIQDLRVRAKIRGDVDPDGTCILDIGSGVLMAAQDAINKALGVSNG